MLVSIIVYLLCFLMFIFSCLFKFGLVLICYLGILLIWFLAEYFGLYSYVYRNYELINKVHSVYYNVRDDIKKTSEVYNYFYNSEV